MTPSHTVCTYALLLTLASGACGSPSATAPDARPDAPAPDARPVQPLFSIAVVADCHLTTNPNKETRLREATTWINEQASARNIELVFVLGDIGWGAGVNTAKGLLDTLTMPYAPVIGDNEIHGGSEQTFNDSYTPYYDRLATTLDGFRRAPLPVMDPVAGEERYLQNFAFDYRGLHIVGLDFNDRETVDLEGELGVLHDYPGGTMPWLAQSVSTLGNRDDNSMIMLSHIPMHNGTFDAQERDDFEALFEPYKSKIYGNLAGHIHVGYEVEVADLYTVYVMEAMWLDDLKIRLIHVGHDGVGFVYTHEDVVVPSAVEGD